MSVTSTDNANRFLTLLDDTVCVTVCTLFVCLPQRMDTSVFTVATRSHNATGYWGNSDDVTHTFCEPHYSTTVYLAEFYNCLSSIVYVFMGIYILLGIKHNDPYIRLSGGWLVVIGIGSMLFHGIMWFWMQLLDEIPMVGFLGTLMLGAAEHGRFHKWKQPLQAFIVVQALTVSIVYVMTQQYEIFFHGYTSMIVVEVILVLLTRKTEGRHAAMHFRSFVLGGIALIVGRVCWETENRLCEAYPSVWPLHTGWHFISTALAYFIVVITLILRLDESQDIPDLVLFRKEKGD